MYYNKDEDNNLNNLSEKNYQVHLRNLNKNINNQQINENP